MASTTNIDSHYDTLGVPRNATTKEIKAAYRELSKSLHPDKNQFGAALFQRINEAHTVLSDPATRAAYDRDPKNCRVPDPPKKQDNSHNNTEQEKKDALLQQILSVCTCVICHEIPPQTTSLESPCCGSIFCVSCVRQKDPTSSNNWRCPRPQCKTPNYLRASSAFAKKVLEIVVAAPTITQHCRDCGKRMQLHRFEQHKRVCLKNNTQCFKCSGEGTLSNRTTIICNSCQGTGVLPGKWTECFKCEGEGGFERVKCASCKGVGALKGFGLKPCRYCKGHGCPTCKWKGCEKCTCGSGCQGHTKANSRFQYEYDSDSA